MPMTLAAANPVEHVIDHPLVADGDIWWISNVTVMLVLASILTALITIRAAKKITTGQRGTLDDFRAMGVGANIIEVICLYLRDSIFRPVLREETDKYTPTLWTFFWFILMCNLLGLVPIADLTYLIGLLMAKATGTAMPSHGIGGTATQSIWVTGALAVVAFVYYTTVALIKDPIGYFKHLTGGAPMVIWPIMIPVEILSTFIKPFALALRLFANMTGGHIAILAILSFVFLFNDLFNSAAVGVGVGMMLSVPLAVGISALEIVIILVQAYVFTLLTAVFVGMAINVHH